MSQLFNGLQQLIGTLLAFLYDLVPSYGLAIILLTIFVNLVLFPLTLKQTRATRAFQKIQPEIRRIQAQYKEDPETLQRELVKVQREAGATPAGCLLPILVQLPIWFALFRVLSNPLGTATNPPVASPIPVDSALYTAIEQGQDIFLGMDLGTRISEGVTGASTAGWWTALPYLLMLVLMVASQYVQQWHATYGQVRPDNPQAQAGQAVTRFMPLFLGVVSWSFPAGLVLYWTTGNIFRLGQQLLIFKIDGRPEPVPPAPTESKPSQGPKPPAQPQSSRRRKRRS